jgi:hypothetical protein
MFYRAIEHSIQNKNEQNAGFVYELVQKQMLSTSIKSKIQQRKKITKEIENYYDSKK